MRVRDGRGMKSPDETDRGGESQRERESGEGGGARANDGNGDIIIEC